MQNPQTPPKEREAKCRFYKTTDLLALGYGSRSWT